MKVCYFGSYDPKYSRNRIIIKGLKQNGVEVFECQDDSPIWLRYFKLLWKYLHLKRHDVIIVGTQGHTSVILAWLLAKIFRRKLIFDPFISLYDTAVFDRKEVDKSSLKAKYYYYLDKWSCALADIVIVDTREHLNYFHKKFNISKSKIRIVYVGADNDVFFPRERKDNKFTFTIYFYGTFIPLHGIQYIIKAAKMLEKESDIIFKIIGNGQTYDQILKLSKKLEVRNVLFLGSVGYEELPKHLAKADVCLGIFGDTNKAKRVIPNKVYDALAMKKPLITGDSPAVREVLTNNKNALLCEMANPEALADAILVLKEDRELRTKIAENGYKLFNERFTPQRLGFELKLIIEECLKRGV
jgi:glycosyltransferase involved in cell wall biosynthesis